MCLKILIFLPFYHIFFLLPSDNTILKFSYLLFLLSLFFFCSFFFVSQIKQPLNYLIFCLCIVFLYSFLISRLCNPHIYFLSFYLSFSVLLPLDTIVLKVSYLFSLHHSFSFCFILLITQPLNSLTFFPLYNFFFYFLLRTQSLNSHIFCHSNIFFFFTSSW